MTRQRARAGDERGTTAVEFAFVVMLILLVTLGAVDFGLWAFARSQASQSAREASRVAMLDPVATATPLTAPPPSTSTLAPVWKAAVAELPDPPNGFSLSVACNPCAVGSSVTVTVKWDRQPLTFVGVLGHIDGSSTRSIVGMP